MAAHDDGGDGERDRGLRRLSEHWLQATWETDAAGEILADSPSWRGFTGQSEGELARYGWIEVVHPDDRAAVVAGWRRAVAAGSDLDVEFRIRTPAGWRWTNARAVPVRRADGAVARWVGVNFDVGTRRGVEAEMRDSEERYRLIVDGAIDHVIVTVDPSGLIRSWSPGAAAAFGWSAESACGRPFAAVCRRAGAPAATGASEAAAAGRDGLAKYPMPAWYLRRDGSEMYLEGSSRLLADGDRGRPVVVLVGRDVTAQRRVEEALFASEARYRTLLESVRDHAVFLCDARGTVVEWTAAARAVTGYAGRDVVGSHLSVLYTPEALAAGDVAAELLEAAIAGKAEREGWRLHASGTRYWSEEVTTALRDRDGVLVGFSKVGRDLTVRRRTEAAEARERRRAVADRQREKLAAAEREERRRLARDLHDTAGQHVTALALGLRALEVEIASGAPGAAGRVRELSALAATLGAELHDVATRLRPRTLDDFGLEDALGAAIARWSRDRGVAVDVHVNTGPGRLPGAIEEALYRIVQEALTNVARHSGAARVGIAIERPDDHVLAVIEDDGRGFSPGDPDGRGTGLGLLGIYERVELLGGTVEIESAPGAGTTLLVRLPVAAAGVPASDVGIFPDGGFRLPPSPVDP